ncbi:hypothetical protein JW824_04030 [bacterium]|nr:hypothetical protein [bacterium]
MKITPIAAESMGSRSMAVFIETRDLNILVDPGVTLVQNRYGLPPHPFEKWAFKKQRERLHLFAHLADVVVITHFHLSHFIPDNGELYRNKLLLLKNPNQKINLSQRNRAFAFLKKIQGIPREIHYVDEKTVSLKNTRIIFSPPVPHGLTEDHGFVIQMAIHEDDQSFLFSSDIEGACREDQLEFILSQNPLFLYLDGLFTINHKKDDLQKILKKSLTHIKRMIEKTKVTTIIIDHHLLRDMHWKHHIEPLFALANQYHVNIQTVAEYRGEENHLLEARRNKLHISDPPDHKNDG